MQGKLGAVARAVAGALTLALVAGSAALAHDGPHTRPPTAHERALFQAYRSAAARAADSGGGDAALGSFSPAFSEPTLPDGRASDQDCVTNADGSKTCKPAAGTLNVLPSGKLLYWNALEGTENIKTSIVNEYAAKSVNDQTRLLDLAGPTWTKPSPNDAGANPNGYANDPLIPGGNSQTNNDGALFCSDQVLPPDGRVLAPAGPHYYYRAAPSRTKLGVAELEGLRNTRIYNP